jgi:hypothetical protein
MAVNIPQKAKRQPTETISLNDNGGTGYVIQFKGPFDDLKAMSTSLLSGDKIDGLILRTWELSRTNADIGVLALTCVAGDSTTGDGSDATTTPKKEVWSLKSVRNDMSLYAYCGPSDEANPNRYQLEMWLKETDKALADWYQFKDGKGETHTLNPLSIKVADKMLSGIESVIRFYPLCQRKRIYADVPADQFSNLGFIDVPPAPGMNAKRPSGLAKIIGEYSWLKIQDDCDEQSDGMWSRTESWMGMKETDGSWDEDLYGENRWPMPLQ